MILKIIHSQRYFLIFGIPVLIIASMIFLASSNAFKQNSNSLAIGITLDLIVTVPFLYYLFIRKTQIPKTTIVPFIILGMVICSFILPVENQQYLSLFKTWVFPVIELSVIIYVIYNVKKGIQSYQHKKEETLDFFTRLKNTCYEILPKRAVIPVVTEIAVFYYGFFHWKKNVLKENEFSYHKNSGSITLLVALLLIIAVETVTLHVLLAKWSSNVAWILTLLSIYSGFQIFGFLKSMPQRPIRIEKDKLILRYGIMVEAVIPIKDINYIEVSSRDIELDTETRKLSFLGALESHNIILHLKEENSLIGLYGMQRKFKRLAFFIDQKAVFKDQLNAILIKQNTGL
jgi:hypothetical protein